MKASVRPSVVRQLKPTTDVNEEDQTKLMKESEQLDAKSLTLSVAEQCRIFLLEELFPPPTPILEH